jgi:3-methyladenine DNA glycosylase AlkD
VFLLQGLTGKFGDKEFQLFSTWIPRISTWAEHDALASYLLGPMIASEPRRAKAVAVFPWSRSKDRWHRRAAAVSLIRAMREQKCRREVVQISNLLITDNDDMVQKGVGWLLREAAKYDRDQTLPYMMKIRDRAPRLVLRTACETLPQEDKQRFGAEPQRRRLAGPSQGVTPAASATIAVRTHELTHESRYHPSRPA